MSDDLISRKSLLTSANEWWKNNNAGAFCSHYLFEFREMIKNQPTAYDVDKVVEQIDKASDHYECEEQGREDVYMVDTEQAIEIVKGGGQG